MTRTVIWHNPRCSKSREALALLRTQGVEPDVVHYLETPPSVGAIQAALGALALPAHALLRTKEAEYKARGLSPDDSEETLIAAMAVHPGLIERPVVFHGARAVIARPPEALLALFS